MKTIKKHFTGFTLVELIIVITILTILATITFISFQSYTKDTRDTVRLTDIKQIYEGLTIQKIQTEKTPLPERHIEITNGSGTLTYQGYVGKEIKRQIKLQNGGQDPLNGMNYTYTTDTKREKIQILGYLENGNQEIKTLGNLQETITKAKAETTTNSGYYLDKKIYIYGDKIGTITNKNKVPLQETTTNTTLDLTISKEELKTYFGGEIYENGTSSQTGTTLINQIISATTNTLPCNEETYNGYQIPSLLDKQTGTATKTEQILHGNKTTTLTITCNNGNLDHQNEKETTNLTCETNNGYINNQENTACIENKCSGQTPENSESTATSQNINGTWTYNATQSGECTYKCKENYTYNETNKTCEADTRTNQTCTGLPISNGIWNTTSTITQTWNGAEWTPSKNSTHNETASTQECRFKCENGYSYNSITNTCDGNSCLATTQTVNGHSYNVPALNHGATTTQTTNVNITNGTRTYQQAFSCNLGILTSIGSETNTNNSCIDGYGWNLSSFNCTNEVVLVYNSSDNLGHNIFNDAKNPSYAKTVWDGISARKILITVGTGVIIGAPDTLTPAMYIPSGFPTGTEIYLNIMPGAYIIGAGGNGGSVNSNLNSVGSSGINGGTSIKTLHTVTINNLGTIGGGGGGGGAGGIAYHGGYSRAPGSFQSNGGGGGGGAGSISSIGGTGGSNSSSTTMGQAGGVGSAFNPGIGGAAGANISVPSDGQILKGGNGGSGGALGQPGASGGKGTASGGYTNSAFNGTSGGTAGYSIDGLTYITYSTKGTVLGPTK